MHGMSEDTRPPEPDPWPLVRELAALVRWYRRGEPIKGVPKYLHGIEADKALARATAVLKRREGAGRPQPAENCGYRAPR